MNSRVRFLAVTFVLLACSSAVAEVRIATACRIKNRPPGRCGWCALETLARHHRFKALYGVTDDHCSTCDAEELETAVADTGVRYRIQYRGEGSQAILRFAVRKNLGAVVGFRELYPGSGGHIVTLVDLTEDTVKVIDSNDADGRTREMTLDRFLYWWDGFALVLENDAPDQPYQTTKSTKKATLKE